MVWSVLLFGIKGFIKVGKRCFVQELLEHGKLCRHFTILLWLCAVCDTLGPWWSDSNKHTPSCPQIHIYIRSLITDDGAIIRLAKYCKMSEIWLKNHQNIAKWLNVVFFSGFFGAILLLAILKKTNYFLTCICDRIELKIKRQIGERLNRDNFDSKFAIWTFKN